MSVSTLSTSPAQPPSVPLDAEPFPATEKETDRLNGIEETPTQFVGNGEAHTQRSPPLSSPRHKKSGSLGVNGTSKEQKPPKLIVQDFPDRTGQRLTSLLFDDKPRPQRSQTELVSGRRAGASWDRSQYVQPSEAIGNRPLTEGLSIHFAPFSVPLKRRLQTLMVLSHTLSIALFLTAFFLLCAIPLFWPLLFPYTKCPSEEQRRGGRRLCREIGAAKRGG